jgi:hypothetical protein
MCSDRWPGLVARIDKNTQESPDPMIDKGMTDVRQRRLGSRFWLEGAAIDKTCVAGWLS